jgi:RNA polymerase sigma factor (sigma-70 family)
MTILALLKKCKENNRLAQQELYDCYKSRLMGVCRRYARNREEAQDILQESFFRILTKINQVDNDNAEKLEGWMMKVTVHTAINYYHAMLKYKGHVGLDENMESSFDNEVILSSLSNESIIETINQLPHGAKVVFNLYAVEGYSHKEISKMIKVSEGTSRSQFHYARSLLKAKLTKSEGKTIKYA